MDVSGFHTSHLHQLKFSGAILEKGFWLYAWRIENGSR
jgi:hypothetical protein